MARILIGKNRWAKRAIQYMPHLERSVWQLESGLFALFLTLARRRSLGDAQAMGQVLLRWFGPRQSAHQHVMRNLERAFPQYNAAHIARLAREVWGQVGMLLAEYPHLETIAAQKLDVIVDDQIEALRGPNAPPAVFVSAHVGNWELVPFAGQTLGARVATVYTPLSNPYLDRQLARYREPLKMPLLARDRSMRALVRHVQQGDSLGFIMDQRVDSGAMVPFFGVDKRTTLVPARLALRHQLELVPCRCRRTDRGRFEVTFYAPIHPSDKAASELVQAHEMTTCLNALFADWIREYPEQWFCTKRR